MGAVGGGGGGAGRCTVRGDKPVTSMQLSLGLAVSLERRVKSVSHNKTTPCFAGR